MLRALRTIRLRGILELGQREQRTLGGQVSLRSCELCSEALLKMVATTRSQLHHFYTSSRHKIATDNFQPPLPPRKTGQIRGRNRQLQ